MKNRKLQNHVSSNYYLSFIIFLFPINILNKYIPKVEANNKKIFGELLEIFEVDIIETIMKFPLYNYKELGF